MERDDLTQEGLTTDELDAEEVLELPDREEMSVVHFPVMPIAGPIGPIQEPSTGPVVPNPE